MKGVWFKCAEEMLTREYGREKWQATLKGAGLEEDLFIPATGDISDHDMQSVFLSSAKAAGLSKHEFIEKFADYWATQYAPRIYAHYFDKAKNTRELLLSLDSIHTIMTNAVKGASPPRFKYKWESENVLLVLYQSSRGWIEFMPALIRGVGKHYREELGIAVKGNTIRVQFS